MGRDRRQSVRTPRARALICTRAFFRDQELMETITHYPLLVFVLTFAGLWIAARVGAAARAHADMRDPALREDFGVILAATLTLLGLIIGFSFSMATNRYDLRKTYEEAEANAIGTEYVRAELLPASDAAKVKTLLRAYTARRIQFYSGELPALDQADARTAQLQDELWSVVRSRAAAEPTPVIALTLSGMNDVLNSQGYTQAAFLNRIPTAAWALMAAIAVCCNVLLGFGSRSDKGAAVLLPVLPLVVAIAFMLIADIDSPRHGVIRVVPQNLLSLAASLRP
ncbi:MAG: hypothetical protein ABI981_12305 [Betaproteobacteria bacterium]